MPRCEYCGGSRTIRLPATHRDLKQLNAEDAISYIDNGIQDFPCPACSPVLEKECVKDYRIASSIDSDILAVSDGNLFDTVVKQCVHSIADKMYKDGMFEVAVLNDPVTSGMVARPMSTVMVEVAAIDTRGIKEIREERDAEKIDLVKHTINMVSDFYMRAHDMMVRIARLTMDDEKTLIAIEKEHMKAKSKETQKSILEYYKRTKDIRR